MASASTHRPLGFFDRIKMNRAIRALRSPFHSVRMAAHREIQKILAKYDRNGRSAGRVILLPRLPQFRLAPPAPRGSAPPSRGRAGPGPRAPRTRRGGWRAFRGRVQRAQEPALRRAERRQAQREAARDAPRRNGQRDGDSRGRAQRSREHFDGRPPRDPQGRQMRDQERAQQAGRENHGRPEDRAREIADRAREAQETARQREAAQGRAAQDA